jgi:hypothetical protein
MSEIFSRKVPIFLVQSEINVNFLGRFSKKKSQISNFMKIRPVGADGADGHIVMTKAGSRFSQFCQRAQQ